MGKQVQGFPHKLRQEDMSASDEALWALMDALSDEFPIMADEAQADYERRLKSVALTLVSRTGYLLVRTPDRRKQA